SSKGHIDLSLKSVNEHQRREKVQQWKNETKAEKLLEIVASRLEKTLEQCWEEFGYELVDKFETLYGAFESCAIDDSVLEDEELSGDWTTVFVEVAKENVTPPFVQISGFLELRSPAADGVDRIKAALKKGQESAEEEMEIQYIGAPRYRLVMTAPDYKTAEEALKVVTNLVIAEIKESGGDGSFHRESK
ncbi:MAG: translation initiation factor IF-2 subunit alpha, partial [Methanomassiliicoccales archaeon]|nr:translation initiation factor IF-2 subunit alpha [Methanomassiliicoccales archaeon]